MAEEQPKDGRSEAELLFHKAMREPTVHKLYANSFSCGFAQSDVTVVLEWNDLPMAIVNLAPQTAKALARSLQEYVTRHEARSGQTPETNDDDAQ